jgi:hypothetical protein
MSDKKSGESGKLKTSGWYVLLAAWAVFAVAYLVFSKMMVQPPADVTNAKMLMYGGKYGSLLGIALGLLAYLATGLVYLIARFLTGQRRLVALLLTAAGYGAWTLFGYDLVYLEPRYAEVARAIITYAGKPLLYAGALVVGLSLAGAVGCVVRLVLARRKS